MIPPNTLGSIRAWFAAPEFCGQAVPRHLLPPLQCPVILKAKLSFRLIWLLGESHMYRWGAVLAFFCCAIAHAAGKNYETGIVENVSSSKDTSFYQGTSDTTYFDNYDVRIGDMIYTSWCRERLLGVCDTNFVIGANVQARIDGSHLYLVRANGKEQKTSISRRRLVHPVPTSSEKP